MCLCKERPLLEARGNQTWQIRIRERGSRVQNVTRITMSAQQIQRKQSWPQEQTTWKISRVRHRKSKPTQRQRLKPSTNRKIWATKSIPRGTTTILRWYMELKLVLPNTLQSMQVEGMDYHLSEMRAMTPRSKRQDTELCQIASIIRWQFPIKWETAITSRSRHLKELQISAFRWTRTTSMSIRQCWSNRTARLPVSWTSTRLARCQWRQRMPRARDRTRCSLRRIWRIRIRSSNRGQASKRLQVFKVESSRSKTTM